MYGANVFVENGEGVILVVARLEVRVQGFRSYWTVSLYDANVFVENGEAVARPRFQT